MKRQDVDENSLSDDNKIPTDQTAEEVLRINKVRRSKRNEWMMRAFALGSVSGRTLAQQLWARAGSPTNFVGFNANDNSLLIFDSVTPANNYNGTLRTGNLFKKFTYTRASTATFVGSNGLIQTASTNVPRIHYDTTTLSKLGYLHEGARTNSCLFSDDMTNAAWVKTTMTAAKDQTGADGVANSASSLTATAGNATCLQAITLGSALTAQSSWIKRITGSGTINMTMDNGATWTAVTVTAAWTKVRIPAQTLANPTVGFRIVTNGDAIAIQYCQNEGGGYDSSSIPTTTVTVTRSKDAMTLPSALFNLTLTAGTLYTKNTYVGGTAVDSGNRAALGLGDGGGANQHFIFNNGAVAAAATLSGAPQALPTDLAVADGVFTKNAYAYALNDFSFVQDARTPVTDGAGTLPTPTTLYVGDEDAVFPLFGTIQEMAFVGSRLTNATMQTLTS